MNYQAYCIGLKKTVNIINPRLVEMASGRHAVKGAAEDNPNYTVSRILSRNELERARRELDYS